MSDQNSNQSLFKLPINENVRTQLRGAASVAGVGAILSLVSSILSLISTFLQRNTTTLYRAEGFETTTLTAQRSGNIVGGVIMLAISILLFYFLNRFSSQVKQGLNGNNSLSVTYGLSGLSSYFITVGILLILFLLIVLLAVAAILGK
jgi:hypothetical protein